MNQGLKESGLRSLLGMSCVILAATVGIMGCSKSQTKAPEQQAPSVEIIKLTSTNYQGYAEIVGNTEAPATVVFQAQVSGYLQSTPAKEGLMVKSNDLLFKIDPSTYQAALEAAQAQLLIDEAKSSKADADLVRNKELLEQEVISAAQYDVYDATAKECKASVELSKAKVLTAQLDLGYTEIRAPFDGLLGEVKVRTGNLVSAGQTQLGSMNIMRPMWVSFPLNEQIYLNSISDGGFEASAERLEKGSGGQGSEWFEVELVMLDGKTYPEKGKIFFVDREFSQTTGNLKVKAEFPNPNGYLRPNQFGRVRIPSHTYTNVFVIPQSAIMQLQNKSMAYVVDSNNLAQMRILKVEYTSNNEAVVSEGVKEGESLVVKGLLKLRNGLQVTPMTAEETQAATAKIQEDLEKKIQENEAQQEKEGEQAPAKKE